MPNILKQLQLGLDSPFFQLESSTIFLSAIARFLLIVALAALVSLGLKRFLSRKVLNHLKALGLIEF